MIEAPILRWEDPPPAGGPGRPHEWAAVADELTQRPGEWALVEAIADRNTAANHARAIRWLQPRGSFDAVSRSSDVGYRVYARFVGGES